MSDVLSKSEVEKIVKDEINKFIKDTFAKEMKKELANSSSPVRKEMIDAVKKGHLELAKFLWLRKDAWINNIK